MTVNEHTPGPWVVESNPTIPEGKQVAAFEPSGEMAGNRYLQIIIRSHSLDADAHLIAAAPELFEALCKTRRTIQALIDDGHVGYVDLRSSIDAAIAKATGEEL